MRNKVKEKLSKGGTALGAWMGILNERTVAAVTNSDLDWVLIDCEHGPTTMETLDRLVRAAGREGALPIARVVWNDMNAIKMALDTGAYGIVVPWVNSAEEAEKAVAYSRYMPEGLRGCAAGRPASAWGISAKEYMDIANDEILVVAQIETMKAVNNIEEILAVEGVDATFIGPSDLSASMGYRGQFWHPEVVKAMDRVLEACKDSKVAPGIAFGKGPAHCGELIEQGYRFIAVGSDTGFIRAGIDATLSQLKR